MDYDDKIQRLVTNDKGMRQAAGYDAAMRDLVRHVTPLDPPTRHAADYGAVGRHHVTLRDLAASTIRRATDLDAIFTRNPITDSFGRAAAAADAAREFIEGAGGLRRMVDAASGAAGSLAAMRESGAALAVAEAAAGLIRDDRLFRLASATEAAAVAAATFATGSLAAGAFADMEARTGLAAAAAGMRQPWLSIADAAASARAFVDIQAIGRDLDVLPAFDRALGSGLRPSLGDWRDPMHLADAMILDVVGRRSVYSDRGMDPALTAFTDRAFDEMTTAAGLDLVTGKAGSALDVRGHSGDDDDRAGDGDAARSARAFAILRAFEREVRDFIVRTLHGVHGDGWTARGLPPEMLDRWTAKRDAAIREGADPRELVEYADFADYKLIIELRANWRGAFRTFFNRSEDVRESFQRLYPVRIATMHARPITLDDELLLVETKRVRKAIARRP